MLTIRPAKDRGRTRIAWLDARHSFSFGDYHDPAHTRFRTLRVLNDDTIAPAGGFPTHPHRDMEIITYIVSGALEHQDSTGGGGVLRPGDIQHMSAGRGVLHSEFNHSKTEPVRLLQIWITPREKGIDPVYQQAHFPEAARAGTLLPVASADGHHGSMPTSTDATVYATALGVEQSVTHALAPGRGAWIQAATGGVTVNGQTLAQGDGLAIEDEATITITGDADRSEILLLDLA